MKKRFFLFLLIILFTHNVHAVMTCNSNITNFFAAYDKNYYTCSNGEFLPANTAGCVSCPSDSTCSGGTYSANTTKFQGIELKIKNSQINNGCAKNFPKTLIAVYDRKILNCNPGYYLPANIDECTLCPNDNLCIGGTYTFNETTDQGIEPCPNGTYAPGGTAYCYPHILHIGDDVVYLKSDKLTTPSLNIGMNDGIFYANMTTIPTYMNRDSEHYLRINYNNTDYYVCDDTTCGE